MRLDLGNLAVRLTGAGHGVDRTFAVIAQLGDRSNGLKIASRDYLRLQLQLCCAVSQSHLGAQLRCWGLADLDG